MQSADKKAGFLARLRVCEHEENSRTGILPAPYRQASLPVGGWYLCFRGASGCPHQLIAAAAAPEVPFGAPVPLAFSPQSARPLASLCVQ